MARNRLCFFRIISTSGAFGTEAPASAGALSLFFGRASHLSPDKNPALGRGLGNPHLVGVQRLCYEGSASQTHGRAKGSSRNVWHKQAHRQRRPYSNARTPRFGRRLSLIIRAPWATVGRCPRIDAEGEVRSRHLRGLLLHSSSASRFTAGASEFFILSQSGERLERYVESFRFDTILRAPSRSN
jgi:hypothetical protein